MPHRKPERVTLFDRVALAVGGAVIGYISGLALGWALMLFGAVVGLLGPSPTTGRLFFYQLPIGIMIFCSVGFAILPNQTSIFIAKIWHAVLALSRRF